MRISSVRAAALRDPSVLGRSTTAVVESISDTDSDNPLSRYERYLGRGRRFHPRWPDVLCVVTADDGTWGLGMTSHAGPVVPIVNDYLAQVLLGEDALETERLWDVMARASAAFFGAVGAASYAASAVDLALWDLRGKALDLPVYELLGGPTRGHIDCYATGNDPVGYVELGFGAVKLPCGWGAASGAAGVAGIEDMVASTRAEVGDDIDLMPDLWGLQDVDFTIAVGEATRAHGLTWLEDCVFPEAWPDHRTIRDALPDQTLAAGEKWYTAHPFRHAAELGLVDVLQPDIQWVGGLTPTVEISHVAVEAGLDLAVHVGTNDSYGQHACLALPHHRWSEFYIGSTPGDLADSYRGTPGMGLPVNGRVTPSDAPGFGIELTLDDIEAAT